MKIEKIGHPQIIMSNPSSPRNYFGWPTVARLKDGRIAVGASGFRLAHRCPFGKSVVAFSDDEGKTYTKPFPVIDTVLDDRDAGLCPFGDQGLICTSFNNTVHYQRTRSLRTPETDAYLDTISAEAEQKAIGGSYRVSYDNGNTWGEIFRSPVIAPHGPIELANGKILFVGRMFPMDNCFDPKDKPYIRAFELSLDGQTKEIGHIEEICDENGNEIHFCEPHTIELPSGKLICHMRAETPIFSTFQTESYDGGKTWTAPHALLSLDKGGAPAHILRHSSGILISAYGYRKGPYGVKIMFSENDGETWQTDNVLFDDSPKADVGYPATVELKDGTLLTVYYVHPTEDDPAVIMQQRWKMVK